MKKLSAISPGQTLIEAIAADAPPERIAKTLADALSADLHNRDGSITPDHKTRIAAAQILLNYSVGRPVERIESVNVSLDADSSVGLAERLKKSPALRKSLQGILDSVITADSTSIPIRGHRNS